MKIWINGNENSVDEGISVHELIKRIFNDYEHLIVEHNKAILKKDQWKHIILRDADSLEVIKFVGGG